MVRASGLRFPLDRLAGWVASRQLEVGGVYAGDQPRICVRLFGAGRAWYRLGIAAAVGRCDQEHGADESTCPNSY